MDERLLNVIEAVKELDKSVSKEGLIEFITDEFDIRTHMCDKCKTNSIIYLESESAACCLYCNECIDEDLTAECECGGQGIIEGFRDGDGIWYEEATCLKCGKKIEPDECWHDGETGYNFARVVVDADENGEDMYAPVCPRCYDLLYDNDQD